MHEDEKCNLFLRNILIESHILNLITVSTKPQVNLNDSQIIKLFYF